MSKRKGECVTFNPNWYEDWDEEPEEIIEGEDEE